MTDEYQGSTEAWRVCYEAEKAEVERLAAEVTHLQAVYDAAVPVRDALMHSCRSVNAVETCNLDDAVNVVSGREKCFWPTGCANSERCSKSRQCIARYQNANKDKLFGIDTDDSRQTDEYGRLHDERCAIHDGDECSCLLSTADSRPTEDKQ